MSYKGLKPTFEGLVPPTGTIIAFLDCELINWVSFQIQLQITGVTPNVTIMIEESNKLLAGSFKPTLQTKNYTANGATNDILFVSQATSRFYRVKLTFSAGAVDSYEVTVSGKG